jgi:hypothetical protein
MVMEEEKEKSLLLYLIEINYTISKFFIKKFSWNLIPKEVI